MQFPKLTDPADFDGPVSEFDFKLILEWALADGGGGLPSVSARPFAAWLDENWNEFDDGEDKLTNKDVLEGALGHWTGRS